ncbi:hypothetical protein V2I01_36515 [Micromonospora sp. BRA006-A]|nr:hypothetical protein [Micromonospora sp. BRA006-A]
MTDPLLWDLAAAVADAHQPDDERVCASPSCAGAACRARPGTTRRRG